MKIKKYNDFILEEISGTEIPQKAQGSYFGPAFGSWESPNTISKLHTNLTNSEGSSNKNSKNDLTSDIFTIEDYKELHVNYLKAGGDVSVLTGNRSEDIQIMTNFLQEN